MIFIGCGECRAKYQIMEAKHEYLRCPSCGTELPEKLKTSIIGLIEESRNRPNWKLHIDLGNMFNTELTLKSK